MIVSLPLDLFILSTVDCSRVLDKSETGIRCVELMSAATEGEALWQCATHGGILLQCVNINKLLSKYIEQPVLLSCRTQPTNPPPPPTKVAVKLRILSHSRQKTITCLYTVQELRSTSMLSSSVVIDSVTDLYRHVLGN